MTENVFSKLFAISCEYPKILKLSLPSLVARNESPNLLWSFNVKLLTLALNCPFWPLGNALTSVALLSYPIPVLVTTASITCPFSIIGLATAPAPAPVESVILSSGLELYSLPLFTTTTLVILPSIIIGLNSANLPFSIETLGITSLSRVTEP